MTNTPAAPQQFDYDLFVLGAGSGGLACAKRAARYGARVAIAEADKVGGTCVIRGCVPKKMMVNAAQLAESLVDARGYGFNLAPPTFDFSAFVSKRDAEVARLNALHIRLLEEAGVTLHLGRAVLADAHTVQVGSQSFTAAHILIAVGGTPTRPDLPGFEHAMTSDQLWALNTLPQDLIVIGGGYIGCEFASIFQALGTQVTLALRHPHPLNHFDPAIQTEVSAAMTARGLTLATDFNANRLSPAADGTYTLHSTDGRQLTSRHILAATGRAPNTHGLGLEALGLELTSSGAIVTDAHGTTHVPHIYALGDCVDRANLTPVAVRDGRILAERLFNKGQQTPTYDTIATAVFTLPPVGTVGLTEPEAHAQYGADAIATYTARFTPMVHSLSGRAEKVFMKMLVHKASDKVLGLHMVGRDAAEIIQGFAVPLTMGATKADFDRTVAIHPTSAEEFVTLV